MKKDIYLVQSCPKDEFRKFAKKGYKCNTMGLKSFVLQMWATSSKREAIDDCRNHNRIAAGKSIYFINKIDLYN